MQVQVPGYRIVAQLGRGGFATVYRAVQVAVDREVALKVADHTASERDLQRFERECRAMGALSWHPGIVGVHDAGTTGSAEGRVAYIAMELLPAGSLGDEVEREGRLEVGRALHVAVQVAGALQTAHDSGLVHRDVKPDNILIDRFGNAKLADFGISRLARHSRHSTNSLSPGYAGPEVTFGGSSTPRSDIFSLGSVLHHMVTGLVAYQQPDDEVWTAMLIRARDDDLPSLDRWDLPEDLATAIRWMLRADPDARPGSAAAAGEALQAVQRGLGLPVTDLVLPEQSSGPTPRVGEEGRTLRHDGPPPAAAWRRDPPAGSPTGGSVDEGAGSPEDEDVPAPPVPGLDPDLHEERARRRAEEQAAAEAARALRAEQEAALRAEQEAALRAEQEDTARREREEAQRRAAEEDRQRRRRAAVGPSAQPDPPPADPGPPRARSAGAARRNRTIWRWWLGATAVALLAVVAYRMVTLGWGGDDPPPDVADAQDTLPSAIATAEGGVPTGAPAPAPAPTADLAAARPAPSVDRSRRLEPPAPTVLVPVVNPNGQVVSVDGALVDNDQVRLRRIAFDGTVEWTYMVPGTSGWSIAATSPEVVVWRRHAEGGLLRLQGVDVATGTLRWSRDEVDYFLTQEMLTGDHVRLALSPAPDTLSVPLVVDATTGEDVWRGGQDSLLLGAAGSMVAIEDVAGTAAIDVTTGGEVNRLDGRGFNVLPDGSLHDPFFSDTFRRVDGVQVRTPEDCIRFSGSDDGRYLACSTPEDFADDEAPEPTSTRWLVIDVDADSAYVEDLDLPEVRVQIASDGRVVLLATPTELIAFDHLAREITWRVPAVPTTLDRVATASWEGDRVILVTPEGYLLSPAL